MKIRQATENDHKEIYELVKIAFQTAQVTSGSEQDFVEELRARNSYIPELELIAEENDRIIAHIMLTKQLVHTRDNDRTGLLIAPLCVEIEQRNIGIGGKLLSAGLEKAQEFGYSSIFLVGNPEYYQRFGFQEIAELGIENKTDIPNQYVLGLELEKKNFFGLGAYIDEME
ncbi:GNAT family N-acetyltransferase [Lactovum odontotermitis]